MYSTKQYLFLLHLGHCNSSWLGLLPCNINRIVSVNWASRLQGNNFHKHGGKILWHQQQVISGFYFTSFSNSKKVFFHDIYPCSDTITPYHTCSWIWTIPFYYGTCWWVSKSMDELQSVDPSRIPCSALSDLVYTAAAFMTNQANSQHSYKNVEEPQDKKSVKGPVSLVLSLSWA